jgi:EmrB/QacA subfamily drug resistance transporter
VTARAPLLTALMLGLASGAILVPLNSTMLAVGLPGVMSEFGLGPSTVASLVTLYLGSVAIALPLSGALGDRFGHRPLFVAGVVGFGAASFIASIATSFSVLELARVLQAACGALVSTTSTALVRESAPANRRGEAFGIFDLLVSTSAAVGPFIGGLLVGAFGWRSMFVLAIPIAVLAAVLVAVVVRPAERHAQGPRARLDVPGLVLLALVIIGLLVVLRNGLAAAGLPIALATIAVAVGLVVVELRTERPAIDIRLLGRPSFAGALIGVFGATVVLHGCFLIVPLLVEELLGGSARSSGLVLLGIAGLSALVAPWGGRLSDRRGRRLLAVAGAAVVALGLAGLSIPIGTASEIAVGLLLGVVGLGLGLSGSPRQAAAFDGVAADRIGMAAGTYYTARYLGGVVGASLAGAVLGGTVTQAGVSLGFGILTVAALVVVVASFALPSRSGAASLSTPLVDG